MDLARSAMRRPNSRLCYWYQLHFRTPSVHTSLINLIHSLLLDTIVSHLFINNPIHIPFTSLSLSSIHLFDFFFTSFSLSSQIPFPISCQLSLDCSWSLLQPPIHPPALHIKFHHTKSFPCVLVTMTVACPYVLPCNDNCEFLFCLLLLSTPYSLEYQLIFIFLTDDKHPCTNWFKTLLTQSLIYTCEKNSIYNSWQNIPLFMWLNLMTMSFLTMFILTQFLNIDITKNLDNTLINTINLTTSLTSFLINSNKFLVDFLTHIHNKIVVKFNLHHTWQTNWFLSQHNPWTFFLLTIHILPLFYIISLIKTEQNPLQRPWYYPWQYSS